MSANPEAPSSRTWSPKDLIEGRYRLVRLLGEGGAAHVWLAEDIAAKSLVALKALDGGLSVDHLRTEFARLARISHPNVVTVHDFGLASDGAGAAFFTMDYIDGLPLTESVPAGDLEDILPLLEGAAAGLEAIHAAQLIHGDVKPANILVLRNGADRVRLVDLNLSADSNRGRTGGTPGFVAPEVVTGGAATPLSDLYGLGASFYTALAGRAPFIGASVDQILQAQIRQDPSPEPLRASGVSPDLIEILLRLLSRDPAQRPRSVTDLREMLQALSGRKVRSQPLSAVLAVGTWVGREKEIARIESRTARGGLPLILTGRSGMGRSRLLREMALRAEMKGGHAVVVSCRGRSDAGDEWLRRVGIVGGTPAAPLSDLLTRLKGAGPILLAFEDLQAASEADLDLARRLLVSRTPAGALVILSWDESAAAENERFEEFSLVARGPWLEESPYFLHLPALAREDSDALVRSLLGGTSLPAIEEAIWKISGGAPAWIEGAARALVERGALVRDADGWRVTPDADLAAPLPALERIHAGRLASLSSEAKLWLAALACLGGEAPVQTVREMAGGSYTPENEVAQHALAVIEDRSGEAWARLDPPSIAPVVLRSIPPDALNSLYAAAAEHLSSQPFRAAELWLLAGSPERALAAVPAEADADLSANAAWARAELRLRAHEQMGSLGAAHLLEGALAAKRALKMQAASELWERYAERARADSQPLEAVRGLLEAAECARWLADHDRDRALLDQAEVILRDAPSDAGAPLRSLLLSERSWLALIGGDMPNAEALARSALEIAPTEFLAARFTAWNRLAAIYQQTGQLQEARDAISEAIRLATQTGDELALARVKGNAAVVARMQGDLRGEVEGFQSSIALAERNGAFNLVARGHINL
ncbi:MAG TPA: protein kinase, partial [Candidatus Eisenbacteria bacterium]|nr:protein kinase [Candidatus Eisenbacteria bacterium]